MENLVKKTLYITPAFYYAQLDYLWFSGLLFEPFKEQFPIKVFHILKKNGRGSLTFCPGWP
jgi:hypothetical protein